MGLTVLSVAYALAPVSLDAAGGAEQVLAMLDEGLVRAGHRSIVVACEGSSVRGELVVGAARARAPASLDDGAVEEARAAHGAAVRRALAGPPGARPGIDVVHMHGIDFDRFLPPPGPPVLVTAHLPPPAYAPGALPPARARTWLACVSEDQRARHAWPSRPIVVPNGVPLDRLRPRARKRAFAAALGRICPDKGFHLALDAASAAGVPLVLAGEVFGYPSHVEYFQREILPRLVPPHVFAGPVGLARKRRLLAAARCLLVPSLVDETSSLVAMEALASGTPVIAFPAGALASLIDDGRTGFLVRDAAEMARAIPRAVEIDPAACRRAAEARFSAGAMIARYLEIYERLAADPDRALSIGQAAADRAPSIGHALEIEEVRGLRALERLEAAWCDLWRRDPRATPFQHPAWLLPHARHLLDGEPRALLVRRGGALVGLAPIAMREAGAARVASLLGAGVTDYLDALLDPAVAPAAAAALLARLADPAAPWDRIDLDALRPDSPLLAAPAPPAWSDERLAQEVCPYVRVAPGGLESTVPRSLHVRLLRCRRRAERLGPVREHLAGPADLPSLLDELLRLHALRWSSRGEPGVLAAPGVARFHRDAAPRLLAAGLLRLLLLRIGDRPAAAVYALAARRRVHNYLAGFDPELYRLSPGSLALAAGLDLAAREGAAEVDFLRGAEPYKRLWGAVDRPLFARRLRRIRK